MKAVTASGFALVPEDVLLDGIIRAVTGNKYCAKRNPWMKINPSKAKSKYITAKTPYFSRAWGGSRPDEVEAINDIFKWAAEKLDDVHPDARTDIIAYYMMNAHEALKEKGDDEVEKMSKGELEAILGDAFRKAVAEALGLTNVPGSVEEAIRLAREYAPAVKKPVIMKRKLSKRKLVAISKLL